MLPAVPPQAINHTGNAPAHQQNARPPATREANIRANQRPPRLGENVNPPRPNKPKLRANINIATLNMNGYTAPSNNMSHLEKWTMINQTINKHRIAILALQETHLDQERVDTLLTLYGKKMDIVFSRDPNAPRATAGVAFVINKTLIEPKKLTTYELQAGRALALNIDWLETENTTLINIYAQMTEPDTSNSGQTLKQKDEPKE